MELTEESVEGIHVVTVTGRLDATCAPQLTEKVSEMLAADKKKLLIDMDDVGFVDSSGLGTLVGCLQRATTAGGQLKIVGLKDHPKRVFQLTRLDRVFEIFEDRQNAVASYQTRPVDVNDDKAESSCR